MVKVQIYRQKGSLPSKKAYGRPETVSAAGREAGSEILLYPKRFNSLLTAARQSVVTSGHWG
jgi:hypothetical protein